MKNSNYCLQRGKVMFLHLCVILFMGVCPSPRSRILLGIQSTRGRYASYWNAYLLLLLYYWTLCMAELVVQLVAVIWYTYIFAHMFTQEKKNEKPINAHLCYEMQLIRILIFLQQSAMSTRPIGIRLQVVSAFHIKGLSSIMLVINSTKSVQMGSE